MGITSLKNKINKRIKVQETKNDYSEIGVFIKKRRKDLNLTQDIICNGICSVSYLSKIENGQIEPNEMFVREIITKLDIEEDYLKKNLEDKSYLNRVIRNFFYVENDKMRKMYDEIKDIDDNLTINLCKFGYQVFTYNRLSSDMVTLLENLVMNMNDKELKTYLFFTSVYFITHDDYKTSLELLLLSIETDFKDDYLDALIEEYLYYVKQRLLKKNCSLHHYEEASRVYSKFLNNVRSMRLLLNRIKFLSDENPALSSKLLDQVEVSLLAGFNYEYYCFLKAKVYYLLGNTNESVIYLSNIKESSLLFVSKTVLLYEICLLENDEDMLLELRNILDGLQMSKADLKDKVYYHFLTQKDDENRKEYLRDIAIPFSIKTSDYSALKYYVDHIMEICIESSRYKEATQYYKKYSKEIKKVEKILYSL